MPRETLEESQAELTEREEASEGLEASEGDKPDDKPEPKTIPIERFNQVYGELKRLKELGSPDEVKSKLSKLEQYERAIEQYRQQQQQQEFRPKSREAQLREQLIKLMPELQRLPDLLESQEQLYERVVAVNVERAQARLGDLLKARGIEVSPDEREDIEEFLVTKMTDEQKTALRLGDLSVVDEVLEAQLGRKEGYFAYLKTRGAKAPQKPPTRHGPTGLTPPKDDGKKKPKTLDEAADVAFERYRAAMEGA